MTGVRWSKVKASDLRNAQGVLCNPKTGKPTAFFSGRRHKYGVAPKAGRTVDGIVFDSKAEARRYGELKLLQKAGVVRWFLRQPTFDLPGGVKYRADFLVISDHHVEGGAGARVLVDVSIEDVKGFRTAAYRLKKKQVEALYPIKIQEIPA